MLAKFSKRTLQSIAEVGIVKYTCTFSYESHPCVVKAVRDLNIDELGQSLISSLLQVSHIILSYLKQTDAFFS